MKKLKGEKPGIRFSNFKDLWDYKQLSYFLTESKKLNHDLEYNKNKVLSVSGEFGIVNQIKHLGRSYAGKSVHNYNIVEINDIVYTKSPLKNNPYGIIKMNKGDAGIVSTLYAVYKTKNDKILGSFLEYYFLLNEHVNGYLKPLVKKGAKNTMQINNAEVLKGGIFIPTIEEQNKIVEFLDVIDKWLANFKKQKESLELYKKGVIQRIFSQEIRFKDDGGSNFPEWGEENLGELCKIAKSGGTPKSTIKEYYEGDIPFLAISDITEQGKYLNYASKTISQKGINNSSTWVVPENSLIYSMYASVGFVAINKIPLATSQAVINLILKDEVSTEYVYYFLFNYKQYLDKFIETGTQGNLNAQTVKAFRISLPTLAEQIKIASFLALIDSNIEEVDKKLEKLKDFKKALLQQMFV
jgi:type I restriction enzyme, S subunit